MSVELESSCRWFVLTVAVAASLAAASPARAGEPRSDAGDGAGEDVPAAPVAAARQALARFREAWKDAPGHMRPKDDTGWKARYLALRRLVLLGRDATPALLEALDAEHEESRILAAQALSFTGDPAARDRLVRALADDPSAPVRLYAADALGAIGGFEKDDAPEGALEDPNGDVRAHVRFALARKKRVAVAELRRRLRELSPEDVDAARVGERAPDFELTDALGERYRLASYRGRSAVVLIFIYGDT